MRINDCVDYVVMPQWKLFLVESLNIASLGPIFGFRLIVMAIGVSFGILFAVAMLALFLHATKKQTAAT